VSLFVPINVDSFWMPRASSTIAKQVDDGYYLVYWVSLALFVLVVGGMTYFSVKYRRRSDRDKTSDIDHSTKLEIGWSVIPLLIVIGLFVVGLKGYLRGQVAPSESYEINVTGKKWLWTFTYPQGFTTTGEMAVPAGRPTKLVISAEDVLHSFFIPEFRVKQDAVPGQYTTLWFQSDQPGEYALLCTEYCGTSHSDMIGKVLVLEDTKFQEWIEGEGDPGGSAKPPAEQGERKYKSAGCNTCHSLDGTKIQGPSFKGLWGRVEKTSAGEVTVDENYVRESILNPGAKIVDGYPNVMPTFQGVLKDKDIDNLIAYIKTLK